MAADLFEYLLRLGDDRLVLGHRLSEWCGHAPILEEDIALANIALELSGHKKGEYKYLEPHDDLNMSQSTNDSYPTAIKVAFLMRNDKLIEELQKLVHSTVMSMPDHLREILLLSYFHQFPYKQISDILEIPLGTVKSRLHAAVAHFADRWRALNKNRSAS